MPLKVSLKPDEKMIIGGAVIRCSGNRCDLIVENQVPILRQKDIITEEAADSPCKRIYFVLQLMYIDRPENLAQHHQTYWKLVREALEAAPSMLPFIDRINEQILGGNYYQALKTTDKLIQYEQEVMRRE